MAQLMHGFALLNGEAQPLALASDGCGGFTLSGTAVALVDNRLIIGDRSYLITTARRGDHLWVHLGGETFELVWQDAVTHYAEEAGGAAADTARAPMPGVVVSVNAAPGNQVVAGDTLMIIESMKLETAIKAPRDGVVEAVHASEGATFERDIVLVSLEPIA